jgi:hypothetical protein
MSNLRDWSSYVNSWTSKIEAGVPIPKTRKRSVWEAPPFPEMVSAMNPGDSVLMRGKDASTLVKLLYDKGYTVSKRHEGECVRVWRTR